MDDLTQAGFRQHLDGLSMESKLFATNPEDATAFGRDNYHFDAVPFHLIGVRVPTAIAEQFEWLTLDSKLAVNVSRNLLPLLNRHAIVCEITPMPMR